MVEGFITYPKVKRVGDHDVKDIFSDPNDAVVVQEKIDGANFRFMVKDGNIIFGSRSRQLTNDKGEDADVDKNFKRCVEYIREMLQDKDLTDYDGMIFFGENCVKHTLDYDWDSIPPFLGFDIYDTNTQVFLTWWEVRCIYYQLGLKVVPEVILAHCSDVKNDIQSRGLDSFIGKSYYASPSSDDTKMEGVVVKNYDKQMFAKYVRDEFKEKNAKAFGGSPKYNKVDDTDNAEFIFKYCTNARIEKIIFSHINEGKPLDMKLMGSIIKDTYLDIIEEEWREILTSNWKLDFKKLRKAIAPRCRAVLEQMITNNAVCE